MAETSENISVEPEGESAEGGGSPAEWFCKNCGQHNADSAAECMFCGFDRGYDPEAAPKVDLTRVTDTLREVSEQQRKRVLFYAEVAKDVLLLVLIVVLLIVGTRLMRNWPFQGAYERDAERLLDTVLTVQSYVDLGVTKAKYDELIAAVTVESTKFSIKYGERAQRQLESYQKLYQAAEFYATAGDAWQKQLEESDPSHRGNPSALSGNANSQVQRLWENAKRNALIAIEQLD